MASAFVLQFRLDHLEAVAVARVSRARHVLLAPRFQWRLVPCTVGCGWGSRGIADVVIDHGVIVEAQLVLVFTVHDHECVITAGMSADPLQEKLLPGTHLHVWVSATPAGRCGLDSRSLAHTRSPVIPVVAGH